MQAEPRRTSTPGEEVQAAGTAARSFRGPLARLRRFEGLEAPVLGLAAIALALVGQHVLRPSDIPAVFDGSPPTPPDIWDATRWYAIGIVILILGWWGAYMNRSLLRYPLTAAWLPRLDALQLALVLCAALWFVLSLVTLERDWASTGGGILWVGSLLFLAAAFIRERSDDAPHELDDGPRPWRLPRWAELGIFAAIVVLATVMRLWRLGDMAPGMHGDEGEVGTDALAILHGAPSPLFERGWFGQSNVYYWTLAVFMKVFGTGLLGLRSFVAVCGVVTVVFTYLLGREMFGQRGAIIAGSLMAVQSADLIFSRQEFSNGAIPALGAMAFYFAIRGLRTRRHLDFVLSGFAAGFSLYYFAGGRLLPPMACIFFAYLAVLHPRAVKHYWTRMAAFLGGLAAISMPFVAYYIAYPLTQMQYPNDRFIWLHHAELAAQYGTADWRMILWDQLQTTLSILTLRADGSAMRALNFPIARPLEAALVVLGLAWAAWRVRDTRYFLLSLWFWSVIIVGGVLTLNAPNLPRIMAMLPVLPLLIAAVLDHLAAQLSLAAGRLPFRWRPTRSALWAEAALVILAIAIAGVENWRVYIDYYLNTHQNAVTTEQAIYVQDAGPGYRFYGMGAPMIYWSHGDNRFINPQADGVDAGNPSNYLPVTDNGRRGQKGANFLVWPSMPAYADVIRAYYPRDRARTIHLGDPQQPLDPLVGVVVPPAEIDAHRVIHERFTDAAGTIAGRVVTSVGSTPGASMPSGLQYPVHATWDGDLVAPVYDTYRFRLAGPPGARLTLDGVPIATVRSGAASRAVILAYGPHALHLAGALQSPAARVVLEWARGPATLRPIPQRFLWDGHIGRAWLGTISPVVATSTPNAVPVLQQRVDGFLGFRNLVQEFGPSPLAGSWVSDLTVRRPGRYTFRLSFNGQAVMLVDGRPIIQQVVPGNNPLPIDGGVYLTRGHHRLSVRVSWPGPFDYLECYWAPPGQSMRILVSPDLHPPSAGVSFPAGIGSEG